MTDAATPIVASDAVRVVLDVDAPIERAFRVFTERFDSWWPRTHSLSASGLDTVTLESAEGGRWFERGLDGTECDWGRVLVWDPPTHLALSWQLDREWNAGVPDEMASRIDVTFAALDDARTRVEFVHGGIAAHGPGWETIRDNVGAAGGWPEILASFVRVVT
jgi:uncharacterized protein YndB with AHSA1/START domain